MAAPLWGSGGMPPRKIWNFRHSEILSRAMLQVLHQSPVHCCSWSTKGAAQLGLAWRFTSTRLDRSTIFSTKIFYARSTPKRFPINWCIAFCANTAYTRGTFTKLSKEVFLICSHHVHEARMCLNIRWSALHVWILIMFRGYNIGRALTPWFLRLCLCFLIKIGLHNCLFGV